MASMRVVQAHDRVLARAHHGTVARHPPLSLRITMLVEHTIVQYTSARLQKTQGSHGILARLDEWDQLHYRMPVILERDLEDAWPDTEITSASKVLDILEGSAGVTLDAYPVSRLVNKPSIDSKALIQRVL